MDACTPYVHAIQQVYPDLPITAATIHAGGQYNTILIVNEALLFRFPKYSADIHDLAREVAILLGLQERITLEIPRPTWVNLEARRVGEAFVGYPLIPGAPLWPETLWAIDDPSALQAIAAQLGTFLSELHQIPPAVINESLPVRDTAAEWTAIFARIQSKLFPHMRPDARAWATQHFAAFLDEPRHFANTPVLKHGDFGPSNIIFEAQTCTVRGIIDFGGAALGDPAYDFAGLLGYGEAFVQRLAPTYPGLESLWDRISFYSRTFALLEALFGIEQDDPHAFANGIADYR